MDTWASDFDDDVFDILLELMGEFGFDFEGPKPMRDYFLKLQAEARQSGDDLEGWFRYRVEQDFRCLREGPEWTQNAE